MEQQKKKRSDNWSCEEKEILRHLISQSAKILEDKSTKTTINLQKSKEWKNISNKFNEITGKFRSDIELKLAWKRMKLTAKANISSHRREVTMTGGGEKPLSPSPEDLEVMSIAPHDFIIEVNDYDSDSVVQKTPNKDDQMPPPPPVMVTERTVEVQPVFSIVLDNAVEGQPQPNTNLESAVQMQESSYDLTRSRVVHPVLPDTANRSAKKAKTLTNSEQMRQSIVQSNTSFKKRQLEMLEEEHKLNIEW